ncbi:MAG: AI-2E family transporter [Myxococcales bacterium]
MIPSIGTPSQLPSQEPKIAGSPPGRADLLFGASLIGLTALVVALVVLLRAVAIPVLLGAAAAYTLDPLVTRLERRGLSRTAAAIAIGIVLLGGAVTFLAFVVPALGAEAARVPSELRALSKLGLPRFLGNVAVPSGLGNVLALLSSRTADVADKLLPALSGLWELALASTGTAVSVLTGLLVTPLVAFYLLRDYHRLLAALADLVPVRYREVVFGHVAEVDGVMAGFVRGQLTVGALLSILYSVALGLSGVHLSLLVGVVTGFGNLIPYVGLISGLSLSTMLALLHWEGPAILLKIALCYGGLSLLDSAFLTPRLVGNRVGLPAAGVVVAILSFGAVFGFVGVLVAVPATALLKVALRALLKSYQASPWYA